jgi:ubiquinone/menaquinone biosynthesis C-methylase UbiE
VPYRRLKKNRDLLDDPGSIYDYFVSEYHIQYSIDSFKDFRQEVIDRHNIDITGKRVLDISGGNGHFADEMRKAGAHVVMTEINEKAIRYAKEKLGIETVGFDFACDRLSNLFHEKFDIVLFRAATMFCTDLDRLAADVKSVLTPGGLSIHTQCVVPTLGVFLRTQCDDYNYKILYQPQHIIGPHEKNGFRLSGRHDETDPTMYVYDHDLNPVLRTLHYLYEFPAVGAIPRDATFPFRARDRRRSDLVFRLPEP